MMAKFFCYSIVASSALVGFGVGVLVDDLPYLSFDRSLGLGEIGNLIVALIIAVFGPYSVLKWAGDRRSIKNIVIDHVGEFRGVVDAIVDYLVSSYGNGALDQKEKNLTLLRFRSASLLLSVLVAQLESEFNGALRSSTQKVKTAMDELWKAVTDGDFMGDGYVIEDKLLRNAMARRATLYVELRKLVAEINKK